VLLAGLVGQGGEVVGTDPARIAIDAAEERVRSSSLANVTFRHGDPAAMIFDKPFDAVVGRYVLQFLPDPSAAIARLASHLHPGGVVFFHELDWDGARSSPAVPTYDQVCGWIMRTIEGSGAQIRLGRHLASAFKRAGLSEPTLRLESVIASGPAAIDAIRLVTDLVATQLPNMERMGVVKASEVALPSLTERILSEVGEDGTLIGRAEVGAWTTV
jgi:SAM-dependent methyltransferase